MTYNPMKDEPKTSDDYIEYARAFLSGDAGWDEKSVEDFMSLFREVVRNEVKEIYLESNKAKKYG